jgi:hypothetical protein
MNSQAALARNLPEGSGAARHRVSSRGSRACRRRGGGGRRPARRRCPRGRYERVVAVRSDDSGSWEPINEYEQVVCLDSGADSPVGAAGRPRGAGNFGAGRAILASRG